MVAGPTHPVSGHVSLAAAGAALITAALAETEQLDLPAETAKLQRMREKAGRPA